MQPGDGETTEAEQTEDAEMMRRLQEEIRNLPVSEHLLFMMHSLSTLAVGRMGVTAETVAVKDLEQARMAIDAFKALMEIVERTRPAQEMTIHRGLLSQLQLAYVGSLEGGAPPEEAAPPEGAAPDATEVSPEDGAGAPEESAPPGAVEAPPEDSASDAAETPEEAAAPETPEAPEVPAASDVPEAF